MKFNLIILSFVCLSFLSCKKDRSCECSITSNGKTVTRTQTAAVVINFPPLPPVVVTPETDTTTTANYSSAYTQNADYTKVSKKSMRENCPENFEESYNNNDGSSSSPTSTITITNSGTKKHSCEIK